MGSCSDILWVFVFGWYSLKKEARNFQLVNMLIIIGISLIAWYLLRFFIPDVRTIDPLTNLELRQAFIYDFTMFESIYANLHIILGISFIIFGRTNRNHSGYYVILAGLFLLVAYIMILLSTYYYYYLAWFVHWQDPVPLTTYIENYNPIIVIALILFIVSILFIIVYSTKIKQKYLGIYGILKICYIVWVLILFVR